MTPHTPGPSTSGTQTSTPDARAGERTGGPPWRWGAPGTSPAATPLPGWEGSRVLTRAVHVDAPPETVHQWLGQLAVAPYSYDILDNAGRRSPRRLTVDVESLRPGDTMMTIFTLRRRGPGLSILLELTDPVALRAYGPLLCCYVAWPEPDGTTTLRSDILFRSPTSWFERSRQYALAWGDLVMMRKQLLTLGALSERTHRERLALGR